MLEVNLKINFNSDLLLFAVQTILLFRSKCSRFAPMGLEGLVCSELTFNLDYICSFKQLIPSIFVFDQE